MPRARAKVRSRMLDLFPQLPLKPPAKDAEPTPDNVRALRAWLDAVTAYGAYTTGRPWRFYEELEAYLGPWGPSGYLLSYGKKYCLLFSQHEQLNRSPLGAAWVQRTLLLLQDVLKELVLDRFRARTLGQLTAEELRRAAFDSHARAYTEGGLAMVGRLSLRLLGQIALIPAVELLPGARNFSASWRQVLKTSGLALPQSIALFFGARSASGLSAT